MVTFFIFVIIVAIIGLLIFRMFLRGFGKAGMYAVAQLSEPTICPACGRSVKVVGVVTHCPICKTRIILNVDNIYVLPGQQANNYNQSGQGIIKQTHVFELIGTDYETDNERVAQKTLSGLFPNDEVHLRMQNELAIAIAGGNRIGHLNEEDAAIVVRHISNGLRAQIKNISKREPRSCTIEVSIPINDSDVTAP